MFDYPTIGAIADYLDARLPGGERLTSTPAESVDPLLAREDITSLSDDEVMRLLLEKLEDVSSAL